jgi:hypothetical protein
MVWFGNRSTQATIQTDSFENYATDGTAPPNWNVVDGEVTTASSSAGSQAFSNNKSEGTDGVAVIDSGDPSGQAPDSITFAYWEASASGGLAYWIENGSGNDILAVGSTNPSAQYRDGNGEGTIEGSPTPDYEAFRRFTITFDWANDQFDLLWEDIGGSTADATASNLPFMNSASGIHHVYAGAYDFGAGSGGDPNGGGDERFDEMWGVESIT